MDPNLICLTWPEAFCRDQLSCWYYMISVAQWHMHTQATFSMFVA